MVYYFDGSASLSGNKEACPCVAQPPIHAARMPGKKKKGYGLLPAKIYFFPDISELVNQ